MDDNIVEDLQPFPSQVDADKLLNQIEKYISQHAILPNGASVAITLWCLASYNINSFRIFPKLTITSPVKRCGKSTVLDLIEAFSNKSFIVSNISSAAVFRIIEEYQPTLIIDEADTFISGRNDDMVGIINSGHAKTRANVIRCTGETNRPTKFSTWTPMVLASIGTLQGTIMDRSVIIPLKRKSPSQTVQRIRIDLFDVAKPSREKLLKWSIDNETAIKTNTVEPPNLGNDRAVDNWLPLFTLANQVSDKWLKKCKVAYKLLNTHKEDPEISISLLADIRTIFNSLNQVNISSKDLLNKLISDKDQPWCEYKNGRQLTPNGLAVILKPYGIKPKVIRLADGSTPRGYDLKQFTNTFDSYLPPIP